MKITKWIIYFIGSLLLWFILSNRGFLLIPHKIFITIRDAHFFTYLLVFIIIFFLYKLTKVDFKSKDMSKKKLRATVLFFFVITILTLCGTLFYSILGCMTAGGCEMAGLFFYLYFPSFIISLIVALVLGYKYKKMDDYNKF